MEPRRASTLVTTPGVVRVLLDLNILVSDVLGRSRGRRGTASQKLVDAALAGELAGAPLQLVISVAMLDRFEDVLLRLGGAPSDAREARSALTDLARGGPEALDPYLLLDASEAPFALPDVEDAHVLATAFAGRAHLLLTDNLADFAPAGGAITPTLKARHADGHERQLTRQLLVSPAGWSLTILHPLELLAGFDLRRLAQETPRPYPG